jgi:hypothetical protein
MSCDTASWLSEDAVLTAAKRSDAVVYAVSARSRLRPEFLRDVTSLTGGRLFEVERTAALGEIFLSGCSRNFDAGSLSALPLGASRRVAGTGWRRG